MATEKKLINLDMDALLQAQEVLGTDTYTATVNEALRRIAAQPARLAALLTIDQHTPDLADDEVMRAAWRDSA